MAPQETAREVGFEPRIGRSVSLDHAAELLGVSRRTIYNRIREGRLQTIRTLGGSQRVLIDSVQEDRSHGCGHASAALVTVNPSARVKPETMTQFTIARAPGLPFVGRSVRPRRVLVAAAPAAAAGAAVTIGRGSAPTSPTT